MPGGLSTWSWALRSSRKGGEGGRLLPCEGRSAEISDRVALASLTECKGCLTSAAVSRLPPSQVQPQPAGALRSAPLTGSRNRVKEHGSRASGTLTVGRYLQPREAPA